MLNILTNNKSCAQRKLELSKAQVGLMNNCALIVLHQYEWVKVNMHKVYIKYIHTYKYVHFKYVILKQNINMCAKYCNNTLKHFYKRERL